MIMAKCSSGMRLMALMSPNVTGPDRIVVVTPWLGVAQATPMAMPPNAQAAQTPANTSFDLIFFMVVSFGPRYVGKPSPPARRPSAEAVSGLLGGKGSPAALAGLVPPCGVPE